MKGGRVELDGVRRITGEHFVEWTQKALPQAHDVILSRRCNPGETAHVHPGLDCALGQNLVLLRSDGRKVYRRFLRWLVRGPDWWEQVGRFINVGAVFDSLKCADIPNFRLPIPPLSVQKAIAHILGTLDDKIELNRRMNETLEGMARAIFKSWFVDFDPVRAKMDGQQPPGMDADTAALFPDGFEESEVGRIPNGWQIKTLEQLTSRIGSGATPRGGSKVYVDEGVALVRSQNVFDYEFVWDGLARITPEAADALSGVALESEDILFNITGASVLRTCVVDPAVLPARVNQHVLRIRAESGVSSRFLHLHLVRHEMKEHLIGFNAGATREAVTKGHLQSVCLAVPSQQIMESFGDVVASIYGRKQSNLRQSSTLAALRDTLLPRLLSGEIRVAEAERFVAAAHEPPLLA